jgi:tyrosyl-tRNA synthetase
MPISPPTTGPADWSEMSDLQQRMLESLRAVQDMSNEVGVARTAREYNPDQRKRALARQMRGALAGGESAAKAEAEARGSDAYSKELDALMKQLTAAEQTIALYESHKLAWSSAQSLIANAREELKRL